MAENKKDLTSLTQLTKQDWQQLIKVMFDKNAKKFFRYKNGFKLLKEKFNVKFHYVNFYNYVVKKTAKFLEIYFNLKLKEEVVTKSKDAYVLLNTAHKKNEVIILF